MWVILAIAGVSSFPFFSTYVVKYIYIYIYEILLSIIYSFVFVDCLWQ